MLKEYTYRLDNCTRRCRDDFSDFTVELTSDLINDLRQGQNPSEVKVVFQYLSEGTMWVVNRKWFMHAIHDFCTEHNIPPSNVTYHGSNYRMDEVYDKWHKLYYPNQQKINLLYGSFGLRLYANDSHWRSEVFVPNQPNKEIRPKRFNCLNANMGLPHRIMLLKSFYENGLLDEERNILSFHLDLKSPYVDLPDELYNRCPIQYDVKGSWDDVYDVLLKPVVKGIIDYNKGGDYSQIYNDTYFTVTTESCECYSFIDNHFMDKELDSHMSQFHREAFLTEKIFRPMIYWHPQLVISTDGTLRILKELGFKTFNDYWDESYDDEPDGKKRIEMITKIVKQLDAMSLEEWHKMYLDMMPILEHNRQQLLESNFSDHTP